MKETYALFLIRCISLLKEGGILSFIAPDTFLYLHNHQTLRKFLLTNTIIREIAIFSSKFFLGVSFGYSNLCIITLQKESDGLEKEKHKIKVIKDLKNDDDLLLLSKDAESTIKYIEVPQNEIIIES